MKNFGRLGLLLIISMVLLLAGFGEAALAANSILGRVVDSTTQAGVPGVSVYANNVLTPTLGAGSSVTDAAGNYTLVNLANGSYQLSFYSNNYLFQGTNSHSYSPAPVTLTGSPASATVNVSVRPGATMNGVVKDAVTKAPIPYAAVSATNALTNVQSAYLNADASGAYSLRGLPGGSYNIQIYGTGNYISQWYNNKASRTVADAVSVTEPEILTLNDALLAKGGTITGKIKSAATLAGILNSYVYVYDAVTNEWVASASADASGAYSTTGLPSGNYKVFAAANGYVSKPYSILANQTVGDTVTVTSPNATALADILLAKGGTISGQVRDAATQAGAAGIRVDVEDAVTTAYVTSGYTDASGGYLLGGIPAGNYLVLFSGPGTGSYISQWYNNKATETAGNAVSVAAESTTHLDDALLQKGGALSGTVKDATTLSGVENLPLYAFDALSNALVASAVTDATGAYSLAGLPSGSYKVQVYGTGYYVSQWYIQATQGTALAVPVIAPNVTALNDTLLATGGTVQGMVKDAATLTGIPGTWVEAFDALTYAYVASASTDSAGAYSFGGLPIGDYKVRFDANPSYLPQWYNNKTTQGAAETVSVTALHTTALSDALLARAAGVSGRVRDAVTQAAIPNVGVQLHNALDNYSWYVNTDVSGFYSFGSLPAGNYTLQVYGSSGYVTQWYNNKPSQAAANTVAVAAPTMLALDDVLLAKGGTISGKVKDAATQAGIPGVSIYVYDALTNLFLTWANTDASGAYSAVGLASGNYKLQYNATGYIGRWSGNMPDQASAVPVSLTAPNTTPLADLLLAKGGVISGTVKDAATQLGIQGISVEAYEAQTNLFVGAGFSDAAGGYSVTGLPSGKYKLQLAAGGMATASGGGGGATSSGGSVSKLATPSPLSYISQWNKGKADQLAADTVAVTAPNSTTGIDAQLSVGGSISGKVTDSGGLPIAGVTVQVYDAHDNSVSFGYTDNSGNYLAQALPTGNLKVSFQGSAVGYVNKVYGGTFYLSEAAAVPVTAPGLTTGINATLSLGGTISGTVTGSGGLPLSGITVEVYDTNSGVIATTYTDAKGSYTATGIPAGSFKVAFYAVSRNGGGGRTTARWFGTPGDFNSATPVIIASVTNTTGIDVQLGSGAGIFYAGGGKRFGSVPLNATDASRLVTIFNYGTADLLVGALSLGGADAAQFSIPNDACSGATVVPGGACLFRIAFSPVSAGPKSASVSIPSSDPGSAVLVIALDGSGIDGTGTPQNTLTTNIVGSGAINSLTQPPFSCLHPSCAGSFAAGTVFNLHASPSDTFEFAGWSGSCSGSADCGIILNAGTTVTASFTMVPLIRIDGDPAPYRTLLAAYGAAATNAKLRVRDLTFVETLNLNHDVTVYFGGGFDGSFSAGNGFTTLQGSLAVSLGTLVVRKLNIK